MARLVQRFRPRGRPFRHQVKINWQIELNRTAHLTLCGHYDCVENVCTNQDTMNEISILQEFERN